MREIQPIEPPDAVVRAPGSKSLTNRGILLGALATGRTVLDGALLCEDTELLAAALRTLGFSVEMEPDRGRVRIGGGGGRIPADRARLDVGGSGTALRFLTALAALGTGEYEIDGEEALRARPVGPLAEALATIGAEVTTSPSGGAPVLVSGCGAGPASSWAPGAAEFVVSLPGEVSSQFASALLLVAPCLGSPVELTLTGTPVSAPYVELTLQIMGEFSARVSHPSPHRFRVEPTGYQGRRYRIEGDATAASYVFAAAAVTGGCVRVTNLPRTSRQGDLAMLRLLGAMGATIRRGDDWAEVRGGPLDGIDVNLRDTPDLVPTLAAVAMGARGETRIRGVPHLRVKESDRIEAITGAVAALGGDARSGPDGIVIRGGEVLRGIVDPVGDHRIAMAFAVLGLRWPGVRIRNPEVVGKSFPEFFAVLDSLAKGSGPGTPGG